MPPAAKDGALLPLMMPFEFLTRTTTVLRTAAAPQLIFLGAPGVGKGTFASLLCKAWKIPHISTGDIIRDAIRRGTPEGLECRALAERGELVNDELVIAIVEARLDERDTQNGFVLDGFPRTIFQAEQLNLFSGPFLAVDLFQPLDIIVAKLAGRRVCTMCKKTYNVCEFRPDGSSDAFAANGRAGYEFKPILPTPEDLEKCKGCANLQQRVDDREDIVMRRLKIHMKEEAALKRFYAGKKQLESFHVKKGLDDFPKFQTFLEHAAAHRRLFIRDGRSGLL